MRYILIVNSRSPAKNLEALDDAINLIARKDPDLRARIEIRYTEYGGHASEIAVEASESFGDKVAIVACGGDGTIHEVANALAFRKTPMICLPFGTGNDFVRSFMPRRHSKTIEELLQNLDSVKLKPIDLVRVDSYDIMGTHLQNWSGYFNNVASVGLDTKVQAAAKEEVLTKKKGSTKNAYRKAAVKAVFGNRNSKFSYSLELENGETYESDSEDHTLISICNGKYYGSGYCPAPEASLTDGVVDVCVIEDVNLPRALSLLLSYKHGRHVGRRGVKTFRATSGIITCKDSSLQLEGNYDGEDFFGHRIRFEVYPRALTLAFFE